MQFKVDENLPVEIPEMLNNAGYDAKSVNDEGLQGIKDTFLIDICKKENRILVTLDTDFSDIRNYSPEDFSGIIVLRLQAQTKFHVINVFKNIIPLFQKEQVYHRLWIVEESRVRIRGE